MNAFLQKECLTSLDIGSSHVSMCVARPLPLGPGSSERRGLEIAGYAEQTGVHFLKCGELCHLNGLVRCLSELSDQLERQVGFPIRKVRATLSGSAQAQFQLSPLVPVKSREIRLGDVEKLGLAINALEPEPGLDNLHLIPGEYTVDAQSGIQDPIGMLGQTLGCHLFRVQYPKGNLINLMKAINDAGLEVETFVFKPLASSLGVMTADDKQMGVGVIHLGHSQTHIAVWSEGRPIFARSLRIGSQHITRDLSIGLRTTLFEAERIKRSHVSVAPWHMQAGALAAPSHEITLTENRTRRTATAQELWRIAEPRARETLEWVQGELARAGLLSQVPKGFVLTGGGAQLLGLDLLAESIWNAPVRVGAVPHLLGQIQEMECPRGAALAGCLAGEFDAHHVTLFLGGALKSKGAMGKMLRKVWERIAEPFG